MRDPVVLAPYSVALIVGNFRITLPVRHRRHGPSEGLARLAGVRRGSL